MIVHKYLHMSKIQRKEEEIWNLFRRKEIMNFMKMSAFLIPVVVRLMDARIMIDFI